MELSAYTYELPSEKIASEPLSGREESRLLVYNKGDISHMGFSDITDYFGASDTLFFNNTRVIPARIHFVRDTGAVIEIFLLEPVSPTSEMASAMTVRAETTWKCLVGNFKKWKNDEVLRTVLSHKDSGIHVTAKIDSRELGHIRLTWDTDIPFSALVEEIGKIPLPPYIRREVTEADQDRYQTVYNAAAGAVAAPTAGLHFTDSILRKLSKKATTDYLTLHVSAGTFMPVKESTVENHTMHSEQMYVSRKNITTLLESERITAVGTTSMRTLESLYWFGAGLPGNGQFIIDQHAPYAQRSDALPSRKEAIRRIAEFMDKKGLAALHGSTSIFIYPGYEFRMCDRLITNFHLPGSTLILLVAAFIGPDWRKVYNAALASDYRFLSYGDSSLLIPGNNR